MKFPIAIVSLLVQAGLGAPACSANGSCASSGSAMLQAQVLKMKARHGDDPSWWAADELVAEHDHRYRTFVNTLLQDTVHCSFELDANAVDSQHRKLFTLVDQVRQLLRGKQESEGIDDGLKLAGEGLQPLKKLLVWLKQYTVVHFDAEEKTMEHVSYMDAMGHKALHRAFYGHVMMWGDIVNEMMKFNGGFHVGNVYVMVAKWLQDHVCVQDKLLGSFIEKSGQLGVINDPNTPDGVTDTMPDCVPSLVGAGTCATLLQSIGQPASVATTVPAPEWFAPAEHLAAHDHWYRAFVNTLLQSPIVCELADSFDTSVKTVDAQHRKLLSLVDQVRQLLLERQQRLGFDDGLKLTASDLEPLSAVLIWLKQYGVVHFDAEEKAMEALSYPSYVPHKALHRAFYGQMMMASEVVANMMASEGGFHVGPIFVFMAKWVQDHICVLDKNIGKFIKESGAEVPQGIDDNVPDTVPTLQ